MQCSINGCAGAWVASAFIDDSGVLALAQPVAPRGAPVAPAPGAIANRVFDVAVALMSLIFFLPVLLVVAVSIALSGPGPIIFGHERIGKDGRIFRCLKFRTMVPDADARLAAVLNACADARLQWATDHKLMNDPRITWFGNFLRKSSLDELPQLFNVLRGEMSIVGPRPIVQAERDRYRRFIADYTAVRPGITGLWQVSGRNNTTYRRRVALDVAYARSKSLPLDLAILVRTVPAVIFARGSR